MSVEGQNAVMTPAELRAQAEKCFRLAAALPPGHNAETLLRVGRDYLEMADRLEAASSSSPPRSPAPPEAPARRGGRRGRL